MRKCEKQGVAASTEAVVTKTGGSRSNRLPLRAVALQVTAVMALLSGISAGQTVTHSLGVGRGKVAQQRQAEPEKSGDEKPCDFSEYRPLNISDFFTGASIVKSVDPIYPALAIQAHIEGTVNTRILVNRKGSVVRVCVVDGHPLLRNAAIAAAIKWRFKPWCSRCTKSPLVEGEIDFQFSLGREKRKAPITTTLQ